MVKLNEVNFTNVFPKRRSSKNDELHIRKIRQIVTAVLVGVVTSLISTFSANQLYGMSRIEEDQEAIIENQNHIVSCMENHETRLARNEEHIDQLEKHLKSLDKNFEQEVKFFQHSSILTTLNAAVGFAKQYSTHFAEIQRGLNALMSNQLGPSLIN